MKKSQRFKPCLVLLLTTCVLVLCFLLLVGSSADAKTVVVAKDGSGDYTKIKDGISAATRGDTVYVKAGIYPERLYINKIINLTGESWTNTTINGGGQAVVIEIQSGHNGVNITGFTITGSGTEDGWDLGILVRSSYAHIFDNNITGNYGGIRFHDASYYNLIEHNIISYNRGTALRAGYRYHQIKNNTIVHNGGHGFSGGMSYCLFENNICSFNGISGADISADDSIFLNNTFSANGEYGIYIYNSRDNLLLNNTCNSNKKSGILIDGSNYTLLNNNCSFNLEEGLIVFGERSILQDNVFISNGFSGFRLGGSGIGDGHSVTNNTCISNSLYGINLYRTKNSSFLNNILYNCSFFIEGDDVEYWTTHQIDTSNTVNEKPVYYYANRSGSISPAGAGQVILGHCEDLTLKDQNLSGGSMGLLAGLSSNVIVKDSTFSNFTNYGIYLYNSEKMTLTNLSCSGNDVAAIYFVETQESEITDSNFIQNGNGIVLRMNSKNNRAHNNFSLCNQKKAVFIVESGQSRINATNNCWGHESGPYHENNNPDGKGDAITDYIPFSPWLRTPPSDDYEAPTAFLDELSPTYVIDDGNITLEGHGTGYYDLIEGYAWRSDLDGEFYNGNDTHITHDALSNGTHTIYFKVKDYFGSWSEEVSTTLTVNGRPWATIVSITPPVAHNETNTLRFKGEGLDDNSISRFAWRSSIDGEFFNDTDSSFSISRSDLSFGNHTIYLKVLDDEGIWSREANITFSITQKPVARIESISPDPGIRGYYISFTADFTDDGNISRYVWRSSIKGEFYNKSGSRCAYNLLSNGTHTIYLKVMDEHGVWSDEVSRELEIFSEPFGYIDTVTPILQKTGQKVSLAGWAEGERTGTGEDVRYRWLSSLQGIIYNGTESEVHLGNLTPGSHQIGFQVRNGGGLWSGMVSYPDRLIVSDVPAAEIISLSPRAVTDLAENTITFKGSGVDDGEIIRYVWHSSIDGEFYNGSEAEFTKTGLSKGRHEISLRVEDDHGFWSPQVVLETPLIINPPPQASLDRIKPSKAPVGGQVLFSGSGTDDGEITRYAWTSSLDGEFYNGTELEFKYANLSVGRHTISLMVEDDVGSWSQVATRELLIYLAPIARILSLSPNPALVGRTIIFSGEATGDKEVQRYIWRLAGITELSNGSSTEFETNALEAGTYTVQFLAQDMDGNWSAPASEEMVVHTRPLAQVVSISPSKPTIGDEITFTGTGTDDGDIVLYVWRSSLDGEFYNGSEASFGTSKLTKGSHEISLMVLDDNGVWSEAAAATVTIEKEEEDDEFFLFKEIGPLPLVAYLVLIVIVLGTVGFFLGKQGAGNSGMPGTEETEQTDQKTAHSPGVEQSVQQTGDSLQTPPPVQPQPTVPATPPQQATAPKQAPAITWSCSKCGNQVEQKFIFCVQCGNKRE